MTRSATVRTVPAPASSRRSAGAVCDVYCFPHAGGSIATFHAWGDALGERARVHAVSYPANSVAGGFTISSAAASIADRLRPGKRSIFLGHSMGCLVAFETIRELERRGVPGPAALIVAAHAAPHLPAPKAPIHALPSPQFWSQVVAMGGTPPDVLASQELMDAVEPRLRTDFAACETYRFVPGPPLNCDIHAFAGGSDHQATAEMMTSWQLHTLGGFSLDIRAGGHFFLHTDPLAVVSQALDEVSGTRGQR
ncbi:thioesterase II family protein [Streptomyces sp. NPDC057889]|uniref:thioesterase II family protein n=1 Tax=unclassified Streptomyces TaxID=2593676 RepID=UPI00367ED9C7